MTPEEKNRSVCDPNEASATQLDEKARCLLSYAIQAPSTHNTQPWKFKITEDSIQIFVDTGRMLPRSDPTGRDLHISLGCATENLCLAAKYYGLYQKLHINLPTNLPEEPVAEVGLAQGSRQQDEALSRLVSQIPQWVNARGVYSGTIDDRTLQSIRDALQHSAYVDDGLAIAFITDEHKRQELADWTGAGVRTAHESKAFRKEMARFMHSNVTRKRFGMPGYTLRMPFLLSLLIPTFIQFVNMSPVLAKVSRNAVRSAPVVSVVYSKHSDDTQTWFRSGLVAQRTMLEFQSRGFNTSIFIAAIETDRLRRRVAHMLGDESYKPQFLFITGIADEVHALTPRESVDTKMIDE